MNIPVYAHTQDCGSFFVCFAGHNRIAKIVGQLSQENPKWRFDAVSPMLDPVGRNTSSQFYYPHETRKIEQADSEGKSEGHHQRRGRPKVSLWLRAAKQALPEIPRETLLEADRHGRAIEGCASESSATTTIATGTNAGAEQ